MTLRPYQATAVEATLAAIDRSGSAVLQMPTGAGKTKSATAIISQSEGPTWFICHRQEIERQAAKAFAEAGIDFGVVSPRAEPDYSKPVQIVSVATLARRITDLPTPRLAIWDECHHVAAKSWSAVRGALADTKHVGLTATPERLDGKGLSEWFSEIVTGPTTRELIDAGWLSDFRYFAPSDPDLTAAKVQAGDYKKGDIAKVMNTPVLIGDAVAEYKRSAPGKRALAFCASIDASKDLVARFNADGILAAHVDGTTAADERDAAVAALAAGTISVLSNVEVFTEGFDLPAIDAVILMRPTKSLALFLQMIGRVLRLAAGKDGALIFDHAGLWLDHGWFDIPIDWSLGGGARKRRIAKMGDGRLRRCPECKEVRIERAETCDCGYEFPTGREIGEYDGQLMELRSAVPEGYWRKFEMAQEIGISLSVIDNCLSKGMPRERNGLFHADTCRRWLRENPPRNSPPLFTGRPEAYESGSDFYKRTGISYSTIRRLVKSGMPSAPNGWIEFMPALSWLKENFNSEHFEVRSASGRYARSETPDGHCSTKDFAKRHGVGETSVSRWRRRGMPSDGAYIPIAVADEWVLKTGQKDKRTSELKCPEGFMTAVDFATRHGVSRGTPARWMARGLPAVKGYIPIEDGDKWVGENIRKCPDGHEPISQFAKRYGVTIPAVRAWARRCLPCTPDAFVPIAEGAEWVSKNVDIGVIKQRQKQIGPAPVGFAKQRDFAKSMGVTPSTINTWVHKGMPVDDVGFVDVAAAHKWISENVNLERLAVRSARSIPAEGYLPLKTFARMVGKENSGQSWVAKGMPIEQCGVHIQRGLEWVRDNTNIEIPPEAWPQANDNAERRDEDAA